MSGRRRRSRAWAGAWLFSVLSVSLWFALPSDAQPSDAYRQAVKAGQELRLQGKTADAAVAYERAIVAAGDDTQRAAALWDLVMMYQAANNAKEALAACQRLLKLKSPLADATTIRRRIAGLQEIGGDLAAAARTYEDLVRDTPAGRPVPLDVLLDLSRLYRQTGEKTAAREVLKRIVETDPRGYAGLQAGRQLLDDLVVGGDLAAAEALARKLDAAHPEAEGLLVRVAMAWRDQGNEKAGMSVEREDEPRGIPGGGTRPVGPAAKADYDRATALCREELKAKPNDGGATAVLFDTARAEGAVDRLIADAKKAAEGGDKAALGRLAVFAANAGQMDEALAARERLLAQTPDDVNALRTTADVARQAEKYDRAVELYRRVLHVQPADSYAAGALGDALAKLGHTEEAIAAWKQATGYRPGEPNSIRQFGRMLSDHALFAEAIRLYLGERERAGEKLAWALNLGEAYEGALKFREATSEYLNAMAPNAGAAFNPEAAYAGTHLAVLARDEVAGKEVARVLEERAAQGELPGQAVPALVRARLAEGVAPQTALKAFDGIGDPGQRLYALLQLADELEQGGSPGVTATLTRALTERLDPMREATLALRLAQAEVAAGNWQAGLEALQAHRKPGVPRIYTDPVDRMRAELLLHRAHKVSEARAVYAELSGSPNRDTAIAATWGLADCAFAEGDYPTATEAYQKLMAMPGEALDVPPAPPNVPPGFPVELPLRPGAIGAAATAWRGAAYAGLQVAEMDFREGKLKEAKAAFQKLAAADQESGWAAEALERVVLIGEMGAEGAADAGTDRFLLALKLRDRGDTAKAREILAQIVADPGSKLGDEAQMTLAEIVADAGEAPAAREAFEEVASGNPESPLAPRALLEAARIARGAGDKAGAIRLLEKLSADYRTSPASAIGKSMLSELRQ